MNYVSPTTAAIRLYPLEHQSALSDLVSRFGAAADLIQSNPPLAVCLAKLATCETPPPEGESRVGHLIRKRRRLICALLGFPKTESTVRILAKVAPEACDNALLKRVRLRLHSPCLLKILSHMKRIGHAELQMAAHWKACPHMSRSLFVRILDETVEDLVRARTEKETMPKQSRKAFHSIADVQRCHVRLGPAIDERESVNAAVAETRRCKEEKQERISALIFPPAPVEGTPTIQPVVNAEELLEEGCAQNHCVGGYGEQVAAGSLYVYRVMEPERATVSIRRGPVDSWRVEEIAGLGNSRVSDSTLSTVELWLAKAQGHVDDTGFIFRPRWATENWLREHADDEYLC